MAVSARPEPEWIEALEDYHAAVIREKDLQKAYEASFAHVDVGALDAALLKWVKRRYR